MRIHICGIYGSGKSTLAKILSKKFPDAETGFTASLLISIDFSFENSLILKNKTKKTAIKPKLINK